MGAGVGGASYLLVVRPLGILGQHAGEDDADHLKTASNAVRATSDNGRHLTWKAFSKQFCSF